MTDRLYYTDAYRREFDATVVEQLTLDGKTGVCLDHSAFYPTSGGQPFDLGALNGTAVTEVIELEDGRLLHVTAGDFAPGTMVTGRIDWQRRFDHMQQHTGQHILSAAFERVLSARTESFHLGAEGATIDLSRELKPEEITRAEEDANRVVWEDREVAVRFVDAAEAARLPLRKEPARDGILRLVDVTDYDLSACGGTHVSRTGAVGIIAVSGWEKFRAGTRISFVCGERALRRHRLLRDVVSSSGRVLSVHERDLPAAIERLQSEVKDANRRLKDAHGQLAGHQAAALAADAGDGRVIAVLDGWDPNGLKTIASAMVREPGRAVALLGTPAPSALVVARSSDVGVDAAAILKEVVARFGGKGGGRPELAQGGGLQGDPQEIQSVLRELLGRPAAL
jgi:alanyl-tRNA synthetase